MQNDKNTADGPGKTSGGLELRFLERKRSRLVGPRKVGGIRNDFVTLSRTLLLVCILPIAVLVPIGYVISHPVRVRCALGSRRKGSLNVYLLRLVMSAFTSFLVLWTLLLR